MNLARFLMRTAAVYGARPALALGKTVVADYATLADRAARLAGALRRDLGLRAGDRVALVMKNCPEYWEALFAVWHAGLAAVPVNAKLHPKEFAFILENSGARACIATPGLAPGLTPLIGEIAALERVVVPGNSDYDALFDGPPAPLAEVAADALAWIFYTSGTTGQPKGAMLSHRSLRLMAMNYFADVDGIEAGDCIIHSAPQTHGSGMYGLPHVIKGALQVTPESGGFDVAETLELIAHYPGCSFFFAPTMVHRLVGDPATAAADTSNLKTIVYGGGPMYVEDLLRAIEVLGPKFTQIYGQGEAPMTITGLPKSMIADTAHPRYRERLASVGFERSDVEVRVVDEADAPLPPGMPGEVVVRGELVMQGYWNNPEATAAALQRGWLHTGDLGVMDEFGFLTLKDRSKDLIISGGTNIYPREVEEALLRHPRVAEASVVGRPHADWGEEVVAFVVVEGEGLGKGSSGKGGSGDEALAAELDAFLLDNIARFKRPKEYRFVAALPKNNYGKVLKTELRRILAEEG